jgi:hypothetical protein
MEPKVSLPCSQEPAICPYPEPAVSTILKTTIHAFSEREQYFIIQTVGSKGKGKAVPLQAWVGPEDSRKLRFLDFLTTAQDGGKVVSLTHRPHLHPGNTPGTYFC